MKREIEFKWRVRSPVGFATFRRMGTKLGAHWTRPNKIRIKDFYVDTHRFDFLRTRWVCRLREANGHWEITFKSPTPVRKGLASRLEKKIRLPSARTETDAFSELQRKARQVFDQTRPVTLFVIRNNRRTRRVTLPDGTRMEASFDRVRIRRGRREVRMREIELEFLGGNLRNFKKFGRAMTRAAGLELTHRSKVATAVVELNLAKNLRPHSSPFRKALFQILSAM